MKIKLRTLIIFSSLLIASSFTNSGKWLYSNLSFNAKRDINFVIEEDPDGIVISNGLIQLKFANAKSGFGLYSLANLKTGYEFLDENIKEKLLWKIKLRNARNQIVYIDNTIECDRTFKIDRAVKDSHVTLDMFWKGINIGSDADILDVQASIRLDESGLSYWKLIITQHQSNRNRRGSGYGTWVVTYPVIRGIKASKDDNMRLAISNRVGMLIKNPIERMPLLMRYPSRTAMQFSTLFGTENKSGLYLAAYDSDVYQKIFNYKLDQKGKSLKYEMLNYPEGMGQSANGFSMPYEAVVGVYEGDWITAAQIYREWALKQKWSAKGKLSQRSDIPQWILDNTLWFSGLSTDKMIPLAKYLDVPIAFHWYKWATFPENISSRDPDYFDFVTKEFTQQVTALRAAGIRIMPYIDSRFWSTWADSWKKEHPEPYACKVPYNMIDELDSWTNWQDLTIIMEHWSGGTQAVMCPYTKFWQDKQSEVITRLISEYGVDGIYMDQISSMDPVLCFDPTHGHSLGGGNYWAEGYRKMIEVCKENARKINKDLILTSEDNAEPYIDGFDAHLACNGTGNAPDLIPMFHYVYSGYCITFGRMTGTHWDENNGDIYTKGLPLMMRNAQMFIWGEQMGWFNPNVVELPSSEAEYIKTLCKTLEKSYIKKFLIYGQMVRPPILTGENPILKAKWRINQRDTEMASVSHSAWKAEDGTLGLVFTNLDNSTHKISYTVDAKQYQLPQANQYSVTVIHGVGVGDVRRYKSSSITRTENMPPRSVLVLEIKAYGK